MMEKAIQGYWPSRAPLGYRNVLDPNTKRKTIAPDPDVAPLITKVFEWYTTGQYNLAALTEMAWSAGLKFRETGNRLSRSTLHRVLRTRLYMGEFDWAGKVFKGTHVPIVRTETWHRVQDVIDGKQARRRRKRKHDFTYSGFVRCGHCGHHLVGEIQKSRYVYYHCIPSAPGKTRCPGRYAKEEVLDKAFTEALAGLRLDEQFYGWLCQALRESHTAEEQFHAESVARLRGS
jgi:site-specific DNA recombinase